METMIKLNSLDDVKEFSNIASKHTGEITLFSGRYIVDAKSIMGIFSLDLSKAIKMEIEGDMPLDVKAGLDKFIYK